VRQLFHLIDVDQDSMAQRIFEGPMQLLADAALQTELIGRAVTDDAAGARAGAASCPGSANCRSSTSCWPSPRCAGNSP